MILRSLFDFFAQVDVVDFLQLAFGVVAESILSEVQGFAPTPTLDPPQQEDQTLEGLQLLTKHLLLARVVDDRSQSLVGPLEHSGQELSQPREEVRVEGLSVVGQFFEFEIDGSDGLDVGVLHIIQVSLFVFGSTFLNFILEESEVLLGLVLVETNETLGVELPVRQLPSLLQQILEEHHQKSRLHLGRQQIAVDVLDHVVKEPAVVEVGEQNGVVTTHKVLLGSLLHVVAVRVSEQVSGQLISPPVAETEVETVQLRLGHALVLSKLAAADDELPYLAVF